MLLAQKGVRTERKQGSTSRFAPIAVPDAVGLLSHLIQAGLLSNQFQGKLIQLDPRIRPQILEGTLLHRQQQKLGQLILDRKAEFVEIGDVGAEQEIFASIDD
ncbi:hypothetical protein L596_022480 [Steinernema carpocapsae]|uniref:Uncharacterized protein n=1 Tax=Steinernema carpocapsae TaxID=34508 RepID=A0A4U5MLX6_STECR|nr:hypothetical protein L596_022480 [Steinernema carpocapsae]